MGRTKREVTLRLIECACPDCGVMAWRQPCRVGRRCVPCRNRAISATRIKPKSLWSVVCGKCGTEVLKRRHTRPDCVICQACIARAARTIQGTLQATRRATTELPPCSFECGRRSRFRSGGLCHVCYQAAWRRNNPDRLRELRAAYYRDNRDKIIAYVSARRVQVRSNPADRPALVDFYNSLRTLELIQCYWCGKDTKVGDRHGDHVVPISLGGVHAVSNLVCSCVTCNCTKRGMSPEEWFNAVGRKGSAETYAQSQHAKKAQTVESCREQRVGARAL